MYDGMPLRVRRPNDYNPVLAAQLGSSQPAAHLNLAVLGLSPGGATGADGPDRIFVGGLPYFLQEAQIRELLEAFGPLKGLDIIRDKDTGNFKGYCFCVYADPGKTDMACTGLHGMQMGDKTLTVRRATAQGQPRADLPPMMMAGGMPGMMPGMMLPQPPPSAVVVLDNVVAEEELSDDAEFADIEEDMREELGKYGSVISLVIPRPRGDERPPGLGRVYVEYSNSEEAGRARAALSGRKFAGKPVVAQFFDHALFAQGGR
jgi:splicing factor U2AF subunit